MTATPAPTDRGDQIRAAVEDLSAAKWNTRGEYLRISATWPEPFEALRAVLNVCDEFRGEHIVNAGTAIDAIEAAIARALEIK